MVRIVSITVDNGELLQRKRLALQQEQRERQAMTPGFEADLDPQTLAPRVRFNFSNGWSASIVIRTNPRRAPPASTTAAIAALAACPTGQWGTGKTELGEQEAFPDEVARFLEHVASRPACNTAPEGAG